MALSHNPRIVTEGLVLALDAANPKSYPGSGTTWFDMSGNGYHHNLIASPAYGIIDGAICLDMSVAGSYAIDAGTTPVLGATGTYMGWARMTPDIDVTTWRTLWRTLPNDHIILVQNDTNLIGYFDNNTGGSFQSYGLNAGSLGLEDKWVLYTVVWAGSTSTIYINDLSSTGSVAYTPAGNSNDKIGYETQPFGQVATTLIYNRALTDAEIKQNFEATRSRFGI
jgi:hypothetical protein